MMGLELSMVSVAQQIMAHRKERERAEVKQPMNLSQIVLRVHSAMMSHTSLYGVEPQTLYLNNSDWKALKEAWFYHPYTGIPPQMELFDDHIPANTRFYGMAVEAHPTDSYVCHRHQLFTDGAYYENTTEVSFK